MVLASTVGTQHTGLRGDREGHIEEAVEAAGERELLLPHEIAEMSAEERAEQKRIAEQLEKQRLEDDYKQLNPPTPPGVERVGVQLIISSSLINLVLSAS